MQHHIPVNISEFFVAGINYKKTDACVRGHFSVNNDQYDAIIKDAASFGINDIFVLSTCNRTEIYGFAQHSNSLAALLCTHTQGGLSDFSSMAYSKSGNAAIEHLFNVAAGLDSQILGDYEIVGQIKQSAKFSKLRNALGVYLERMVNEVLQASKKIRTNTALSSGTVSVSFAAVQYIKEKFKNKAGNKILLLGTGKIGRNTCKNLADYFPGASVVLMNRSAEKAKELADEFHFKFAPIENLASAIDDADIILVATNSDKPLIFSAHFRDDRSRLVIDLSVPCNVDKAVNDIASVELINVDQLSKIKDETLLKRSAEIPKVKLIIAEHVDEFLLWHDMRKHVPVLKKVKSKLLTIQSDQIQETIQSSHLSPFDEKVAEIKIQKVIDGMAVKMKMRNQPGCHYIEAINDFISTRSPQ